MVPRVHIAKIVKRTKFVLSSAKTAEKTKLMQLSSNSDKKLMISKTALRKGKYKRLSKREGKRYGRTHAAERQQYAPTRQPA